MNDNFDEEIIIVNNLVILEVSIENNESNIVKNHKKKTLKKLCI